MGGAIDTIPSIQRSCTVHVHVCGNMHTNTHMCNRGEIAWQRLAIVIFLVLGLVA